ncbi:hypothetical protein LEN26_003989 [Aphanomyces euteiches]|nr:hypothetical protein AeMF1_008008 [Aphanomyces euteiches]KAH9141780.1 hypothetical protein LEN26_005190 [Aphanomyces euteiches]KAH9147622.1 hypothetical protein LEN26_004688 [Aphanomyces euteiches]KAH9148644.1 hypothetical protein LEN26_004446 [Aphanomyces euteiches]KAH9148645.1 hypothetical protein LEN26_004447 [Aphanomyces euteiches]
MKTATVFLLAGLAVAQSQDDNEANTTSIDSLEAVSIPPELSNESLSNRLVAAGNSGLANILPKSLFKQIFPNALPIYTYENLLANAAKYPGFANSGNSDVDRREVAAFLGQVALETGNLQYVEQIEKGLYCQASTQYPCASGKRYYGRGAIQLSWNYNYKDFGNTVGKNLVANPGLVASDGNLVWLSAMWFWNTDRGNGNIHTVAGQPGGFAKATNIINGALECGLHPSNPDAEEVRIAGFRTYCKLLGVSSGNNLSCQTAAFGKTSLTESTTATSNEKQETTKETTEPTNKATESPIETAELVAANTTDPTLTSEETEQLTTDDSVQVDGFELSQTRAAKTVSWNWFASSTTDCDASLSANKLNRGLYIGGENIPADCGKTATFKYNGRSVTATYAWRTTGGRQYNELSPQAFARLIGSNANAANYNSATAFQVAINDPGRVRATCSGTC